MCIGRVPYKLKARQLPLARKFRRILRDGGKTYRLKANDVNGHVRNLVKIQRKFCMKTADRSATIITAIPTDFNSFKCDTICAIHIYAINFQSSRSFANFYLVLLDKSIRYYSNMLIEKISIFCFSFFQLFRLSTYILRLSFISSITISFYASRRRWESDKII